MNTIRMILLIIITFQFPNIVFARICLTEITDISHLSFHKDDMHGQPIHVWINADNTPAYDCFKNATNINKRLAMRARYKVVMHNYRVKYNKQHWSLLVKGDANIVSKETIVGWVPHEFLITRNIPMKNERDNIFIKALIKESSTSDAQALSVYTHPDKMHEISEGIKVRTVFYVYDYAPKTAGYPSSPETKRVFIGADQTLDLGALQANLLIGWIDRSKVSFWNTRTACEFKQNVDARLVDDSNNTQFTPQIDRPLEFDELRNPIFKKQGNRYYIGAFARLNQEKLNIKRKIARIATGLEILFVIDGTRSMTDEFNATLSAAKETASELNDMARRNGVELPRFALLFYRDQPTKEVALQKKGNKDVPAFDSYCKDEWTLYNMGSIDKFTSFLENQTACDADSTLPESMYKSLIHGLRKCRFQTGFDGMPKKTRIVIHIGDAGDNHAGDFSPKDVSDALMNHHIFRYISINADNFSTDFVRSVEGISAGKGKTIHLNNLSDLRQKLVDIFLMAQKQSIEVKQQIQIISRGFISQGFAGTSEGRIGVISPEILDYALKIIRANKINPDKLDAFRQYVEGWVEKDMVKEYLLVSQTDIEKITAFLDRLSYDHASQQKRKDAWQQTLKIILGGQQCMINGLPITLEDCNKMRNGIPIQAGFMRYTLKEFLNLSGPQVKIVKCEVKMALEQFRAITKNKYIKQFIFKDKSNCSFDPIFEYDINGDGLTIPESQYKKKNMVDQYFFKEEEARTMAWIPVAHFNVVRAEIK
jgi:hypothetical protein